MKLMTKELYNKMPHLGSTSNKVAKDIPIICKFFDPCGSWTWYVAEGQKEEDDFIFYGFVRGMENEFGNFSLNELQSVKGRLGLGIERDLHFDKHMLSEAIEKQI